MSYKDNLILLRYYICGLDYLDKNAYIYVCSICYKIFWTNMYVKKIFCRTIDIYKSLISWFQKWNGSKSKKDYKIVVMISKW